MEYLVLENDVSRGVARVAGGHKSPGVMLYDGRRRWELVANGPGCFHRGNEVIVAFDEG